MSVSGTEKPRARISAACGFELLLDIADGRLTTLRRCRRPTTTAPSPPPRCAPAPRDPRRRRRRAVAHRRRARQRVDLIEIDASTRCVHGAGDPIVEVHLTDTSRATLALIEQAIADRQSPQHRRTSSSGSSPDSPHSRIMPRLDSPRSTRTAAKEGQQTLGDLGPRDVRKWFDRDQPIAIVNADPEERHAAAARQLPARARRAAAGHISDARIADDDNHAGRHQRQRRHRRHALRTARTRRDSLRPANARGSTPGPSTIPRSAGSRPDTRGATATTAGTRSSPRRRTRDPTDRCARAPPARSPACA